MYIISTKNVSFCSYANRWRHLGFWVRIHNIHILCIYCLNFAVRHLETKTQIIVIDINIYFYK